MQKSHLVCDFPLLYLPQGWFKLVKSDMGCQDCDLYICYANDGIFGYPVCVNYAEQLNLISLNTYVLKKTNDY